MLNINPQYLVDDKGEKTAALFVDKRIPGPHATP